MSPTPKTPPAQPGPAHPTPTGDSKRLPEQAEAREVAGRHKNDGQKDHKGAR